MFRFIFFIISFSFIASVFAQDANLESTMSVVGPNEGPEAITDNIALPDNPEKAERAHQIAQQNAAEARDQVRQVLIDHIPDEVLEALPEEARDRVPEAVREAIREGTKGTSLHQ